MSAQEIHDLGVSEVARIRADMTKIVTNELGQPADLKSFIEKLRNDKSFYYQTPEQCAKPILFHEHMPLRCGAFPKERKQ